MSALSSPRPRRGSPRPDTEFLSLCPVVERHARVVFRGYRGADREEAVAEAVAAAYESYAGLRARGKDPVRSFPGAMAAFAVLHVKDGRHVGGRSSSTDVLSRKARQRRGFRVQSLPASPRARFDRLYGTVDGQGQQDAYEERLRDNTRAPV